MDWGLLGRTLLNPLTGAAVTPRHAPVSTEQRLDLLTDVGAVPFYPTSHSPMLVHGPGAPGWETGPAADGNSAVFACLGALAAASIEAPLRVYREDTPGQRDPLPDHPLQRLLDQPNPSMTAPEIAHWVQWVKHVDGNAYLRKVRAGNQRTGNVVQLWPMSPTRITILTEPGDYITRYRLNLGQGRYLLLPPEDVMHFRLGIDDRDPRRGLAPLKCLVRSLTSDAAAEAWSASLLENGAVPGLLVRTVASLSQEQADQLKQRVGSLYSGDRRGSVGVLDNGADMQQFGFSPEQMAFSALAKQPESRISAVLRVPAIVAGLGVGLDAGTYANASTLSEWFTERTLMPLWTMDAAVVQSRLVPDFTSDPAIRVQHDLSDVRALQEDEDKKYARINIAVQGGFATINEARREVGLDPYTGGDVRRIPDGIKEYPLEAVEFPTPLQAQEEAAAAEATAAEDEATLTEPIRLVRAAGERDAPPERRYNKFHDSFGRFSSAQGGGGGGIPGGGGSSGDADIDRVTAAEARIAASGNTIEIDHQLPAPQLASATEWVADAIAQHDLQSPVPIRLGGLGPQEQGVLGVFEPSSFGGKRPHIFINTNHDFFQSAEKRAEIRTRFTTNQFHAGNSVGEGLVHEVGHAAHWKNSPDSQKAFPDWNHVDAKFFKLGNYDALVEGVSTYALANPNEFVAEFYSGVRHGRTFHPTLHALYTGLGGAPVSPPGSRP